MQFHEYHEIFMTTGVQSHFLLPQQHSMAHYHLLFGSPNKLCSSITESKHIRAIKEPWCRSNHNEALGQMLHQEKHLCPQVNLGIFGVLGVSGVALDVFGDLSRSFISLCALDLFRYLRK